jgi:hypothetical protein
MTCFLPENALSPSSARASLIFWYRFDPLTRATVTASVVAVFVGGILIKKGEDE